MFTSMGIDSNRWIAVICGLLLISFLVSCNSQEAQVNPDGSISLSENLQIDGYGHIDDTAMVDVENDPITCEVTTQEPKDHVCNDGKVWKCDVPQDNPLNSQMVKVDVYSLYDDLNQMDAGNSNLQQGEYTVPCSDEYEVGQNCPLLDCYLSDGEGEDEEEEDEVEEIILTREQILECLSLDIRTRDECREYWANKPE